MSEEIWAMIQGALWITGVVVVGKVLCALTDMWAAWSIGRICDKYDAPPERRSELMQRCRDRKVRR